MLNEPAAGPLPLFRMFPQLAKQVPWLPIGDWPTPVTPAPRFAEMKGLHSLYIKREDLSHRECGGNKIRGLEFSLAGARLRGAKTIITIGVIGSHHVCRTAWHARPLGTNVVGLVVRQPDAEYVQHNVRCGVEAGAKYIRTSYALLPPRLVWQFVKPSHWHQGRPPFYLASGGTSRRSCLGHVNAALELRQQIDEGVLSEPDYLYVALGSLGTAAGLALGCRLAGLRTRLVGVVAAFRWYCTRGRWARLARRVHRLMQRLDPTVPDVEINRSDVDVVTTALGKGYARPTEASTRLLLEMQSAEQIELDGTYTAKTLDGALQYINKRSLHDKTHLFWHTYHGLSSTAERGAPPF